MTPETLTIAWTGIIGLSVFMYVLMDGFDLGLGILFPWLEPGEERDVAMISVTPVWDGNETWLVMGGAGLLGAFPLAYAQILPALYLPILVMLVALVFRGVAFEFRFRSTRGRWRWDVAFAGGSWVATLAQGIVLGAFVRGFRIEDGAYAGGAFDWLSPFSLATAAALAAGYALLGATWLVLKTEGPIQDKARRIARILVAAVIGFMALVSLWVPLQSETIAARWFAWPNIAFLAPVPLATAAAALTLWRDLHAGAERRPFVLAMTLFGLGYLGLGISLWPMIVPPATTVWQAAAHPAAQSFLLAGTAVLLPMILGYGLWSYRVFRGKVGAGGLHH